MFNKAITEGMLESIVEDSMPLEDVLYVKGKTAIVTGGTSGLGFAIANRLCQGGARVVISSNSDEEAAIALPLLKGQGYDVTFFNAELRSDADVKALVDFAIESYGQVDILVTSGGTWSFAHLEDLTEEEFMRVIDVNLAGTFRCAKHVGTHMIEKGIAGKMVLIASNSAFLTAPVFGGYAHYASSKGGVVSMTIELAKELKRYGIMVNCVAPGAMSTPGAMANGPAPTLSPEKQMEIRIESAMTLIDGIPEADSVARVAYAMCTGVADGMTGETVIADGGMVRNILKFQPEIRRYPAIG